MAHHQHHRSSAPEPQSSHTKWIVAAFLAVAGFFLLTEHQAHLYGALPYLLVLVCPLMHFFHGHGSHHGSHDSSAPPSQTTEAGNESTAPGDRKGQS